jgi:HD-like signal output (HDOD) protein
VNNPIVLKILENIANDQPGQRIAFPTLLDIAFKIRALLKEGEPDMERLARLVGAEPLISTQIVRMANSVAMNPMGRRISDVKNAILRVGTHAVRSAAFAIAMKQMVMGKGMVPFRKISRHLWEHSAYTAAFSKALVRHYCQHGIDNDEAMFMGLIHDIGAFYLLYCATQYPELAENPAEVETLMETWHGSISHALLSAMGLSDTILEAVQEHDQEERDFTTIETLSEVLYTANHLANVIAPWRPRPSAMKGDFLDRMFDADTIQVLLGEAEDEINSLKDIISS